MGHLYKFYQTEKLLSKDDFGEEDLENKKFFDGLRKQEIFFASFEKLNDPMEGYKNLFWSGDEVVWKNLLKHYLLCLVSAAHFYMIFQDDKSLRAYCSPFRSRQDLPTDKYCDLLNEIERLFFSNEKVKNYPKYLADRSVNIKRSELRIYLQLIHFWALKCIQDAYAMEGLTNVVPADFDKMILGGDYFLNLERMAEEHSDKPGAHTKFFDFVSNMFMQQAFISNYNGDLGSLSPNRQFLVFDFIDHYINSIEELMYYDCYAACFSERCSNPAMWSHYANAHQGVCLKFKTKDAGDGRQSISLQKVFGGGSGHNKNGWQDQDFYKVQYQKKYPEIDFFRSLGRLSIPDLERIWFMCEGETSSCIKDMLDDEGRWRGEYWDNFYRIMTTKLDGWDYEKEYRLLLYSFLTDYKECSTALRYDFGDLEGIVFGMKTPQAHKIKIMKIIEQKCEDTQRSDFSFYQARYCDVSGEIVMDQLSLLSFKQKG